MDPECPICKKLGKECSSCYINSYYVYITTGKKKCEKCTKWSCECK